MFVCVDALRPSQRFFSRVPVLYGLPAYKQRITCLAQGRNTGPTVSLKLRLFDPRSNTRPNEPLSSCFVTELVLRKVRLLAGVEPILLSIMKVFESIK